MNSQELAREILKNPTLIEIDPEPDANEIEMKSKAKIYYSVNGLQKQAEQTLEKHSKIISQKVADKVIFLDRHNLSYKSTRFHSQKKCRSNPNRKLERESIMQEIENISEQLVEKLHNLWVLYFFSSISLKDGMEFSLSLLETVLRMDLVGSAVSICAAKTGGAWIGRQGIVILETEGILYLYVAHKKVIKVPKKGTIFLITIPPGAQNAADTPSQTQTEGWVISLNGDGLCYKGAERATRKFGIQSNWPIFL